MKKISLDEYQYLLPDEKIARFPVEPRDHSKLLFYNKGNISTHHFYDLPEIIPPNVALVFNDTKVIPARLLFKSKSGAEIEVLLLEPKSHPAQWHCMIGNLKKWTDGQSLFLEATTNHKKITLEAILENRDPAIVSFRWNDPALSFQDILDLFGAMPIPPYLKRAAQESDKYHYQTVYARNEGAVAAPTAGLHFTPQVLGQLEKKNIPTHFLTLHVSAGTFLPVKTRDDVSQHPMHAEHFVVPVSLLEEISATNQNIIAVGTTSARALESIYWAGVKLLLQLPDEKFIEKLLPYQTFQLPLPTAAEAVKAVMHYLHQINQSEFHAATAIMIMPGYEYKIVKGMITNFHQPGSTLIMMIAAFVGDHWKRIYDYALQHDFRFLSYGDSSLLIP
jgi:S-adenosylmethionine:tRNA ribosyltransferase-isomerase